VGPDAEHRPLFSTKKAARGGGFRSGPNELRVSRRFAWLPSGREGDLGVRPSRALDP